MKYVLTICTLCNGLCYFISILMCLFYECIILFIYLIKKGYLLLQYSQLKTFDSSHII